MQPDLIASDVLQGTAKRWEQVAGYVRTRTQEEVLEMVKHGLKAGKHLKQGESFKVAKKRQANTTIHSDATQRHESFTDLDVDAPGVLLVHIRPPPPPPLPQRCCITHKAT